MSARRAVRLAGTLLLLLARGPDAVRAEAEASGEPVEPFLHHTASLLIRVVTEERAEGGAGIGLDYEYRFHESWGVGAFTEYVAGALGVGVFGAMVDLHRGPRFLIGIGPGVETSDEETRGLLRVGGLYEFQAEEVTIAPAAYWDWLEGGHHAFLMGVNFGKRF